MMMSCSPARTGRDRQRYVGQFRLVAGCIPYKFEKVVEDDICDLEKRLLVLMISSPNHDDLVYPKGGWDNDETITEAARREALEEAGVKGILRLTKDDAFKFCRYDWMREALERLLTVLSEGGTEEEETIEDQAAEFSPPMLSVPDARAHQKLSTVCFGTPTSGVQHLDDSSSKCIVLG